MIDLDEICDDLGAEHADLDSLVAPLDTEGWETPTPAEGWSVRDQISHLAFFDRAGAVAVRDPAAFQESLNALLSDIEGFIERPLIEGRSLQSSEVLARWRDARSEMLEVFRAADPSIRVPWYGPPMSPASFISARLMETWAHGQDVADALGVERTPTRRLRHVAFLGVKARPFSYSNRGLAVPEEDVRVELAAPGGESWGWGSGENVVSGSALDFCFVVTQRRHLADTNLQMNSPLASEWMEIAQCFAGPPGGGRKPGQFS